MTLFTACGMLVGETRACMRGIGADPHYYIWDSYNGWLYTQKHTYYGNELTGTSGKYKSWLNEIPELYSRRSPGETCVSAISNGKRGEIENPINDSKGCGGIMRVAPIALHYPPPGIEQKDIESARVAALTHGHSLGYIPAAVLSHILSIIVYSKKEIDLRTVVIHAKNTIGRMFKEDEHIGELINLINKAIVLSENENDDLDNIHKLGKGWVV